MNRPKEARSTQALRFLTSAVNLQGCPDDLCPEVAIVGRSNAGKSTLINGLAGARIALVSSTPGKTRHLNFYQGKAYRLCDMPGYGFSARSGAEQHSWQEMIEPYLGQRENLQGLMIVMDIRREWSDDEEDLLKWLSPRGLPFAIVATKADKMSRSVALNRAREIKKQSQAEHVLVTSSLQKTGYVEIEEFMFHSWIKPQDEAGDES